jgi:hypothetical protein
MLSSKELIAEGSEGGHHRLTIEDMNGAARHYPVDRPGAQSGLAGSWWFTTIGGVHVKVANHVFRGSSAGRRALPGIDNHRSQQRSLSGLLCADRERDVSAKTGGIAVTRGRSIPLSMTAPLVILAVAIVILGILPVLAGWLTLPAASDFLSAFGL